MAMSRARESTHIWTVADDTAQAIEDLRRDWENRRSPTWAIDLAPPAPQRPLDELDARAREERARQIALLAAKTDITRQAATGIRAPDLAAAVLAARADLRQALDARADLQRGAGTYQHSEVGRAVRDLPQARAARQQAEYDAQHAPRWRQRRAATKDQTVWAEREADALRRHQLHVTPEIARLDRTIAAGRSALEQVEVRSEQYRQAESGVADLSDISSRNAARLSAHLTIYRNDVDGLPQPPALRSTRVLHAKQMRLPAPAAEPPTPEPPQLGLGM